MLELILQVDWALIMHEEKENHLEQKVFPNSGIALQEIYSDQCKSGPKCEFFFTTPFLGE